MQLFCQGPKIVCSEIMFRKEIERTSIPGNGIVERANFFAELAKNFFQLSATKIDSIQIEEIKNFLCCRFFRELCYAFRRN